MPKTPVRTIRIPDELYEQVAKEAATRGQTVSEFIRHALEKEVNKT